MEPGEWGRREDRAGGPALVRVTYEDAEGRRWMVEVPFGQEGEAEMGIPVGPPDLSSLGLPEEMEIRLHNQLFHRGLLARRDLRGRGQEVFAAYQAALGVSTAAIMSLYR